MDKPPLDDPRWRLVRDEPEVTGRTTQGEDAGVELYMQEWQITESDGTVYRHIEHMVSRRARIERPPL
jgi:hypothetical protein